MARQNSKYFSSVIEKLIADKHKENIAVDEMFKEKLRAEMTARAALMAKGVSAEEAAGAGEKTAGAVAAGAAGGVAMTGGSEKMKTGYAADERGRFNEKSAMSDNGRYEEDELENEGGWAGFLKRWKYPLALVPSALLVMVVAAHVMNMPVEVGGDVVVPVIGNGEGGPADDAANDGTDEAGFAEDEGLSGDGDEDAMFEDMDGDGFADNYGATAGDGIGGGVDVNGGEDLQDDLSAGNVKKIKTFPGELVLPANVETGDDLFNDSPDIKVFSADDLPVMTIQDSGVSYADDGSVDESGGGGVEAYLSDNGATAGMTGSVSQPVVTQPTNQAVAGVMTTPQVYYGPFVNVPDRTSDPVEKAEKTSRSDDDDDVRTKNNISLTVIEQGDEGIRVNNGNDLQSGGDNAGDGAQTPAVVNPSLAVPLVSNDAFAVRLPVYNVTYETSLAPAEKAALENNEIAALTEGRDVSRVVVGRDDNNYVTVAVYYADGSSAYKTFVFNPATGVWDKVTYVQPVVRTGGLTYKVYYLDY